MKFPSPRSLVLLLYYPIDKAMPTAYEMQHFMRQRKPQTAMKDIPQVVGKITWLSSYFVVQHIWRSYQTTVSSRLGICTTQHSLSLAESPHITKCTPHGNSLNRVSFATSHADINPKIIVAMEVLAVGDYYINASLKMLI